VRLTLARSTTASSKKRDTDEWRESLERRETSVRRH
jgi:hypothetical protein